MNNTFSPSELILNADGSVYHLHLLPHHVADTVITVGDPDRVAMVSRYFDSIEFENHKREFITHTGYIGEKRITVLSSGIGTDNIDIVLNELHLAKNYDFENQKLKKDTTQMQIFRIGTSGCIQSDMPVDSFLISDFGIGIDNLLHFYQQENTPEETDLLEHFKMHHYFHHAIHPYIASASPALVQYFEGLQFDHGITISCPGFYGPQGRKITLPLSQEKFYDDLQTFSYHKYRITNFEMETAAIYGLSKLMGHSCISLNALLANRATGEFSKNPEKTVDQLIKISLGVIAGIKQ